MGVEPQPWWSKAACIATLLHCTLVPAGLLSYCFPAARLSRPHPAPDGATSTIRNTLPSPPLPSPSSQVSPLQLGPRRVYFAVTLCSLIPRYRGDFQPLPPILSAGDWRLIDYDQGSSSRPNSGQKRSKLGKVGMRGGGRDSGSNLLREQKPLSK